MSVLDPWEGGFGGILALSVRDSGGLQGVPEADLFMAGMTLGAVLGLFIARMQPEHAWVRLNP